jgi:hypothetical protein
LQLTRKVTTPLSHIQEILGVENNDKSGPNYVKERNLNGRLLSGFLNKFNDDMDIIREYGPNFERLLK